MESLRKYILYFLVGIAICLVGASGVFADEIIDTSNWVNVTGRDWSISSQEYIYNKTTTTDWVYNYYNVTGGIFTPPTDFDYITYSFFQHSGEIYRPCGDDKFTATFKLYLTNTSFMTYVNGIRWNDTNCGYTTLNNGIYEVTCMVNPSSSIVNSIIMDFNEISGTNTSQLGISRSMTVTCGINTEVIVNNATQNTQTIIENNNSNTQAIIDSNKVCDFISKTDIIQSNAIINSTGGINQSSDNAWGVTDFINITNSEIVVKYREHNFSTYYCFYNKNKTVLSCNTLSSLQEGSKITIPDNASYFRTSINSYFDEPQYEICKNGSQATNDALNNLDDTLNDDDTSGATSEASDFFSDFNTNTFGLTSIITAPLNLIQSLTSSTCNDLELPLPYLNNKKLILPCMTTIYSTHFGSFFTIYQTITYGIIAYWVCVRIFNLVKDFKNPEHDEIEVLDL